jgi:hypothetical protein
LELVFLLLLHVIYYKGGNAGNNDISHAGTTGLMKFVYWGNCIFISLSLLPVRGTKVLERNGGLPGTLPFSNHVEQEQSRSREANEIK